MKLKMLDKVSGYLRHETTTGLQLRELDAFRGWAVLGVLLFHCTVNHADNLALPWGCLGRGILTSLKSGRLGVDLFYCISGFLLFIGFGKAYYENKPKPILRRYFKRRFLRIAPAYYIAVIINLIFISGILGNLKSLTNGFNGFTDILSHFLFLHNISPQFSRSISGPLWTLAIEAQFYLVLPFIVSWFYGKRWLVTLPIILIICEAYRIGVIALSQNLTGSFTFEVGDAPFNNILWRLDQFAIGMCFSNLWLYLNYKKPSWRFYIQKYAGLITLFGLAAIIQLAFVYTTIYYTGGPHGWSEATIMTILYPLLVIAFGITILGTLYSGALKIIIANPIVEIIGIISYSVYLWNLVLIRGLFLYNSDFKYGGLGMFLALMMIALILSTIVGASSYLLFEKPFLARKRV